MAESELVEQFKTAYDELKCFVMQDRFVEGAPRVDHASMLEWMRREHSEETLKSPVSTLWGLLKEHPNGIEGVSRSSYAKAQAFLLDVLEVIGLYSKEFAEKLLDKEEDWLKQARRLLTNSSSDDDIELALALLWLCLRVAEEHYRRGEYESALDSVNRLWDILKEYIAKSEELISLLMFGLPEDTILNRDLPELRKEQHKRGQRQADRYKPTRADERLWELIAVRSPKYADDLLSLLGRLGLTEGKINIRLTSYSLADVSLEQSLRSTSAWHQLKTSKLIQDGGNVEPESKETSEETKVKKIIRIENFARYRIAVAQSYLAYSYYRRGRFRRAVAQVISCRSTLSSSHWALSSIFADMIYAGAARRLAGIHNEEHVNEVRELCEKTIRFFDADILKGHETYTPTKTPPGAVRNHTFLLRACYEMGASSYYLAEIIANDLRELNADSDAWVNDQERAELEEGLGHYLTEASRYAGIIIKHVEADKPRDASFWLANAHQLQAFVAMKGSRKPGETEDKPFTDSFSEARKLIEVASKYARESTSKWQLTDILIDRAYMLNESARHYDRLKRGREVPGRSTDREREVTEEEREKRRLAREALKQLDEAWQVAKQMADEEGLEEPRANFSGQIYLYRADSYALLGNKPEAQESFRLWQTKQRDVEYIRARDQSAEIESRVKGIDKNLVFSGEDGLKFSDRENDLKRWLLKQAIEKGGTDTAAIDLLGVSRATFYAWKEKLLRGSDDG